MFVEAYQSLHCLRIRDIKSTLRNILNAHRCHFKRLKMDSRTITKHKFKYECEDELLIDTNKQQKDNVDKMIKLSPSVFSLISIKKRESLTSADDLESQLS